MAYSTTYTDARQKFAELLDKAVNDREIITITRRGSQDVALIAADELASLMETAYLLRSSKNAERLFAAIEEAQRGEGIEMTVEELRRHVGLDERKEARVNVKSAKQVRSSPHGKADTRSRKGER